MVIEYLDLKPRAYKCLRKAGITTTEELTSYTRYELSKIIGMGIKSLDDIEDKLNMISLKLKTEKEAKREKMLELLLDVAEQVIDEELDEDLGDMVISIKDRELGGLRLNLDIKRFFKIVKERILEYERI